MPEYLLCPISGDFMKDPVMIQSGQTFERYIIEMHFKMQQEKADKQRAEEDSDFDEDRIFSCPISGQVVDSTKMLSNGRIKQATQDYMQRNPWAYDFDPRVKYHQVRL